MKTETVTLKIGDGSEMNAYVAHPEKKDGAPGMIVFQEIFGVNSHIRKVTERWAKEGFVAIAPELFHRSAPGFQSGYADADMKKGMELASKMTPEGVVSDARACFDWLKSHGADGSRISTVGYCRGGWCSFVVNAELNLRSVISYYGGGIDKALDRAPKQKAPLLMFWGGKDGHITPDLVRKTEDALRDAKKDYESCVISEADHGFNCDERGSYNEKASREAWALSLAFLKR